MSKKLFVGNINWSATEQDLNNLFSQCGEVEECVIIIDRLNGRSKGFGFVTFINDNDADQAVNKFNNYDFNGRSLVVNEARPKEDAAPKFRKNRY